MKTNDLLMFAIVGGAAYFLYTHWSSLTGNVSINPMTGQVPGAVPAPSTTAATTAPVDVTGTQMGPGY